MNRQDQIYRAIALINGIKNNVPKNTHVEKRWVDEYHNALRKVEEVMSIELSEFKVEPNAVKRIPVSGNYVTGEVDYSDELFCDSTILLQKIDSVLGYLNILLQPSPPPEKKIGF